MIKKIKCIYKKKIFLITFILLFSMNTSLCFEKKSIKLIKGESILGTLKKEKLDKKNLFIFTEKISNKINVKKLHVGQEILLYSSNNKVKIIYIPLRLGKYVVAYNKNGKILSKIVKEKDLNLIIMQAKQKIKFQEEKNFSKIQIKKNDNLINILTKLSSKPEDINRAIEALKKYINLKKIKVGDEVEVYFKTTKEIRSLYSVSIKTSSEYFVVEKDNFGVFRGRNLLKKTKENSKEIDDVNSKLTNLTEVLRGAGLGFLDAKKAAQAFSIIYPPERLSEESLIIMPPLGKKIKIFAVNLNDKEAVIIYKKEDGSFLSTLSSSKEAYKSVVEGSLGIANIESLKSYVKEDSKENYNDELKINNFNLERGNTLIEVLMETGENIKNVRKAVSSFSQIYKPSKIKEGNSIIIASTNNMLLGFLVNVNKKTSILVVKSGKEYIAGKENAKEAHKSLLLKTKENNINYDNTKTNQITRVSLLNNSSLDKKELYAKRGTNLNDMLLSSGAVSVDINKAIKAISKIYNPKKLKIGQRLEVALKKDRLFGFSLDINNLRSIQVVRNGDNYDCYYYDKQVRVEVSSVESNIKNSLYQAALDVGLPIELLMEVVGMYSYDIDFQRDIREGDSFIVMYEKLIDNKDLYINNGNILYSLMVLQDNKYEIFSYKDIYGKIDYYDENGYSIKKSLMKTPINGARLSSGFGRRVHPVLGYTKIHKGIDFAAKKGTPVYAAGDGKVERSNRYGGYGNYIRIRHNSDYKTAYAHLSKFARNIKVGKKVKQKDIIGYVGSTGRSTGPHLHYEIIFRGKQVNPKTLNLPKGNKILENEILRFNDNKKSILLLLEKTKK